MFKVFKELGPATESGPSPTPGLNHWQPSKLPPSL